MKRVILVPEPQESLDEISLAFVERASMENAEENGEYSSEEEHEVVFNSLFSDPLKLVDAIEAGDEVIAHRFIRNSDGVAIGEQCAGVICIHGIEKELMNRLVEYGKTKTVFEIVDALAKELGSMESA